MRYKCSCGSPCFVASTKHLETKNRAQPALTQHHASARTDKKNTARSGCYQLPKSACATNLPEAAKPEPLKHPHWRHVLDGQIGLQVDLKAAQSSDIPASREHKPHVQPQEVAMDISIGPQSSYAVLSRRSSPSTGRSVHGGRAHRIRLFVHEIGPAAPRTCKISELHEGAKASKAQLQRLRR